MTKQTNEAGARRRFLRTLGAAGAAAATLPIAGATRAAARESREEARKARYQANSAHVQAFYRTNRYER
ncbi:hypothetical protein [Elioraea sp.]|jgi:hypothetical protein|uniref:hypothetical protein n=1 Tax=Elioraea sp. TaxID=2185103 RepID=UPI0021DE7ED2|nr:hypothetical protein [Elioraea sp.]GIX08712.1 MAG: hypothetical protein KatS3mg116_0422 [Elioraea sp.]